MRISDWSSDVCSSDLCISGVMEKQGGSCLRAFFSPRSIMTSMRSVPRPDAIMIFLISSHLWVAFRSEEHTSELQSLMRISYAVFCLKKKKKSTQQTFADIKNYNN